MDEEYRDPLWVFFVTDQVCKVFGFIENTIKSIPIIGGIFAKYWITARVAPMTAKNNPPPRPKKLNPPTSTEMYAPNSTVPRKSDFSVIKTYDVDVNEMYTATN